MKIFGREFKFRDPSQVDIVIFDETNNELVRKSINKLFSVGVFYQRKQQTIFISIKVILNFFQNLGYFKINDAFELRQGIIAGILHNLRLIYYKSCLDVMKPKAVVTYIDNSPNFGWLSKNCKDYPLIGIQNGSRLRYAARKGYYVQHLFCYGEHEKDLFPKIGYNVDNFYPSGSLVASLHFDQQLQLKKEIYDLLIVSTWRGNIGFQQDVKDTMNSMKIMDQLLARYIQAKKIKAAIILRSEKNSKDWIMPEIKKSEEDYFKDIYGESAEIIETDFSKRNIFTLMQKSKVVISCLSSATLEAFGIGKKILYCNFTGTNIYHSDIDRELVTKESNWSDFSKLLDDLFEQAQDDYQKINKNKMNYYMSFPSDLSTHNFISNKIDEIIERS